MKSITKFVMILLVSLLQFSFSFSQDQCTPVGWVTQNGGVTGGGTATPTVVTTYAALKTAITTSSVKVVHISGTITIPAAGRISFQDQTGKTIYGLPGSKLVSTDLTKDGSGILYMKRCTNVILRNITFEGPGAYDTDGWDNITIDNSTNIWVDHCEFQDGMDGNLDIKNAADYISVTWCKFIYKKAPIPGGPGGSNDHRFSNLFGSSDGATGDRGKLRVTMQNCWWAQGCKERMPRVRFGKVHMVNNLFNSTVANKCVMAGFEADLLVESNVFENVNSPIDKMDNTFTAITSRNNIFTGTSGNTTGSGTSFTPPYTLTITPVANVKAQVMAGAGATLTSPVCDGTPPPVTYTLSASSVPTIGGTVSGAGTYNSGSSVTVTATPANGYTFTGWSGDASGTAASISVTMNGNKSVVANFQAITTTTYTLTTNSNPSAGGSVTGAGTYNAGAVATLTAIPAAGYIFTGWSGDATGTTTSASVTMNSDKTATANFQLSGGGGGSTIRIEDDATTSTGLCLFDGSISTNSGANNGKVINLSNSINKVIEWSVSAGTTGSYTLNWRYVNSSSSNAFTMKLLVNGVTIDVALPFPQTSSSTVFSNTSKTVTLVQGINKIRLETTTSAATADIDWIEITGETPTAANCSTTTTYSLSTLVTPSPGGTVTGAGIYTAGTVATVTATPASGYTFTGWSGDASGTATSVNITMNGNKSVTANFTPVVVTYTLTTTASPTTGGTLTGAGTYNAGSVVTVTATPASGYTFTGWSGDAAGTATSISVTIDANKAVTANFAPIMYTLTTTASPVAGGTVTGAGTYNAGSVVTVTATPASGYTFTGWSGDAAGTATSISVTIDANKAVTANFAPMTYTLTTTASPVAGGTVTGAGTYNAGSVVTVTATPASGYTFTGWSGDASGTATSISVTVDANKAITANFTPIIVTYTLTTASLPTAGGTVTGAGTYNAGSVATVTANPASGYTFTGWSGDAAGTTNSTTVSMNGNKIVTANFQLISNGNSTIRIEDNATATTGLCLVEGTVSSNSGANNGKVINLTNSLAKGVNWKVFSPEGGSYTLSWRYVNSSTSNTYTMKLLINGLVVNSAVPFPKTSSSTTFATATVTVSLAAGNNSIRLESVSSNATADIDWIEVTGNSPAAANCSAARPAINREAIVISKIYPNPAKGFTQINFSLSSADKVSIKVYDQLGRMVDDLGCKFYSKGNHQITYSTKKANSGNYLIRIQHSNGEVKTQQLSIL
ncbi:InlB B-repeat-containing protein [Ferruginibacter sp. SUN002]|uniref:InlB B-repeat-containing protein n=1 Tax=Ferruginibacter sp. SUN002 TaxID=2937789 RepID=UPI003D364586